MKNTELVKGYYFINHEYVKEPNICLASINFSELGQDIRYKSFIFDSKEYVFIGATNVPNNMIGHYAFCLEYTPK